MSTIMNYLFLFQTRARTLLKTQAQLANDRLLSANDVPPVDVTAGSSKQPTVKPKTKPSSETAAKKSAASSSGKSDKPTKEKDPNAPKKPSNAFFWFCQDKRSEVQDMLAREGNAGHHDLAKVLSKMWGEATASDKKVSNNSRLCNSHYTSHSITSSCTKKTKRDMRENKRHTKSSRKAKLLETLKQN